MCRAPASSSTRASKRCSWASVRRGPGLRSTDRADPEGKQAGNVSKVVSWPEALAICVGPVFAAPVLSCCSSAVLTRSSGGRLGRLHEECVDAAEEHSLTTRRHWLLSSVVDLGCASYPRRVAPILDRRCIAQSICSARTAAPGLPLLQASRSTSFVRIRLSLPRVRRRGSPLASEQSALRCEHSSSAASRTHRLARTRQQRFGRGLC